MRLRVIVRVPVTPDPPEQVISVALVQTELGPVNARIGFVKPEFGVSEALSVRVPETVKL